MNIPVFVSAPTALSKGQELARGVDNGFEARSLGRSDYPTELPLREVLAIAKHCSGGIILGFEQIRATAGTIKPGTKSEKSIDSKVSFPTPWNQLEAGILFSLGVPLLVFREDGISGGVFDNGVSDVFLHTMPKAKASLEVRSALKQVFQKWAGKVRAHYYD
jgi:hypothetical protein